MERDIKHSVEQIECGSLEQSNPSGLLRLGKRFGESPMQYKSYLLYNIMA